MSTPRLASTVLVLAGQAKAAGKTQAPKVLMIKRHSKARFMANVYVFPGGCVDAGDESSAKLAFPEGLSPSPPTLGGYRTAAVRELQEETGCQLHEDGSLTVAGDNYGAWNPAAGRLLIPYAHWITPKQEKYRYDTRFFLLPTTEAATSLPVKADPKEVADIKWVTPSEALELHATKDAGFKLPPPTFMIMHHLNTFDGGLDAIVEKYTKLYKDSVDTMPCVEPVLDLSKKPMHSHMKSSWSHYPVGVHSEGPAVVHIHPEDEPLPELPPYVPDTNGGM